ncbi:Isoamyl acetate-hydrolyzing esterase 1 -like protein [Halotydeus destructor]|nr:Isoamyl acetate-hydrolyzing esterase 1 -like protein [Halotydeus destructor]
MALCKVVVLLALLCAWSVVSQSETAGKSKNTWSKVILLGDSLTEYCLSPDGQWASLLGDRLKRVADIVVRGFAGYNSKWILDLLPELFPETHVFDDVSVVVIFLGANDAAPDGCLFGQHVPISEYKTNLAAIVQFFAERGVTKDKIILMTPPKFYERFNDFLKTLLPPFLDASLVLPRSDQLTAQYARACVEVGLDISVDTLDLHDIFTRDSRGDALSNDGIHFSAEGSELVFENLWPLVEPKILKYVGSKKLTMNFPEFYNIKRDKPSPHSEL